jgi:hypothetical protein
MFVGKARSQPYSRHPKGASLVFGFIYLSLILLPALLIILAITLNALCVTCVHCEYLGKTTFSIMDLMAIR